MSDSPSPIQARIAQLEMMVNDGQSFSDAIDVLVPQRKPRRRLMQRASALPLFNERLYAEVLAEGSRDPPFDEFIASAGIEQSQVHAGAFVVVDRVAVQHLRGWLDSASGREGLIRLFGDVHDYLRLHPEAFFDDMYRLRFQLVAEPVEGLAEFERLFALDDAAFDLPGCHGLVLLLRDLELFSVGEVLVELKLLSAEQRGRLDELGPYIATRGRFIEEYVKSTHYLERDELEKRFEQFLRADAEWLFPVHGAGGRGKTMFMRWLVARRCLPLPAPLPVAKVDFDDINTVKLAKFPWLILLSIAEQLNPQLKGAPFTEFLVRFAPFAPILLPTSKLAPGLQVDGLEGELEQAPWTATVAQEFAFKLLDHQVVLVLDTLEEPVLHFPGALTAVLDTFRAIRQTVRRDATFKLVLCGRYNLKERQYLHADEPDALEIKPFDFDESERYLQAKRQVPVLLVKAIADKAGGNPFILSLIADLVAQGEIASVADVERLKPEYAYLLERVIKRIPEDQWAVRWVIRYGVVPRRLTRSFLANVMAPHLRRETIDDGEHLDALTEYGDSFPRHTRSFEVDTLWSELRSYADTIGWLRGTDAELRFQPEVVQPMRALLSQERIYRQLHQESAAWFDAQALASADDEAVWAENQADAFHHRLHLGNAGLEAWFEACLDAPQARHSRARATLLEAVVLLVPSRAAIPTGADAKPLLSLDFVRRAHFDLAREAAGIGWGLCPPIDHPARVRELLQAMQQFEAAPDDISRAAQAASAPSIDIIQMALCVSDRDYESALAWARKAEPTLAGHPDEDQYAFYLLQARARVRSGDASAEAAYRRAVELAARAGRRTWEIESECGRELVAIEQVAAGLGFMRAALAATAEPAPELMIEAAELFLRSDDIEPAERWARAASAVYFGTGWQGSPHALRTHRVLARCEVEHGRGVAARATSNMLRATASPTPTQAAQFDELGGLVAAAMFEVDDACSLLQRAVRGYAASGARRAGQRATLRSIRCTKELKGDWGMAASLSTYSTPGSDDLAIERDHIESLTKDDFVPRSIPHDEPATLSSTLGALVSADERAMDAEHMSALLERLKAMDHLPHRYARLHWCRWMPRLQDVAQLESEFLQVVPVPEVTEADFFPRVFASIELLRCLGSARTGALILQAFTEAFKRQAFVCERLIDAAQRAGTEIVDIDRILLQCEQHAGSALDVAARIRLVDLLQDTGHARAEEIAAAMPESLPEALRGTQFEAIHLANGWFRLAETDEVRANDCAKAAASVWRALGQDKEAAKVLALANAGRPEPNSRSSKVARIELRAMPNPIGSLASGEVVTFNDALSVLQDGQLVRRMRDALPAPALTAPVVEIGFEGAASSALPWEWALPRSTVAYRSCANLPTSSRTALDPLVRLLPTRIKRLINVMSPLRVGLIRPSSATQLSNRRGFDVTSSRSLAAILRSHDIEVVEPAAQTAQAIAEMFAGDLHLVYVQAPVIDRRGELAIDIPLSEPGSQVPTALGTDFWSRMSRLSKNEVGPSMLIAPPRPTSDVEVTRQLMLRNQFAADLARKAKLRCIVCAGLFDPAQVEVAALNLALLLAGNPTQQDILRALRANGSGDRFSAEGAALFSADPARPLK